MSAGCRKESLSAKIDINMLLKKNHKQYSNNKHRYSCVWMSTCLVLDSCNLYKHLAQELYDHCESQGITRLNHFNDKNNTTLSKVVNRIGCQLCKVKNNLRTIEGLKSNPGLYICVLSTTPSGMTEHCVGINTLNIPPIILDSCEANQLELNENNLDTCCGGYESFGYFHVVGKLIQSKFI